MTPRAIAVFALCLACQAGVVLDRIAIVVEGRVIKDSDIDRSLRVTAFLNQSPLDTAPAARKEAASRLIDQALIRKEVELAQYPEAKPEEAESMVAEMRKQHFPSDAAFREGLAQFGITDSQLRSQLSWQITVLHFIEQRFRPGVLINDEDIRKYSESHPDAVRASAEEQLAEEQVNKDFFAWLDQERKEAQIRYVEAELK